MPRRLAVLASCTLLAPAVAQESASVLEAPQVITGAAHRMTDVLDLDGDGFADAVGWWLNSGNQITVNTWINDGNGRLILAYGSTRSYVPNPTESLECASATADVWGDG
jgi:hypothetical protein